MNQPTHESSPQEEADSIELAVISLWTTGPDPVRDELFRIAVLRRDADGSWRAFDLFVANPGRDQGVTRRMQREFGVTAKDFEGAPGGEDAWAALDNFVGSAQVLVESREAFEAWARALDGKDEPFAKRWRRSSDLLALDEFHNLFLPGAPRPSAEASPEALLAAFAETLAAICKIPLASLSLIAQAQARAAEALWRSERHAAAVLTFALTLVEHPTAWARRSEALFDQELQDGVFSRALDAYPDINIAIKKARPTWELPYARLEDDPPTPPLREGSGPLTPSELAQVEDIFKVHLPDHFGAKGPRAGQTELAMALARRLGRGKLVLAQAPTGTGKTLAYLVPLCLWALRQDLRCGVATFTRALQDQAAEREVPLALAMLRKAGVAEVPRVVRLKGRTAYLCWRALMRISPLEPEIGTEPDPARLLAWAALIAFGHASPDGDLDGFPLGLAVDLDGADLAQIARNNLVRSVRAETGCCSSGRDRSSCGSSVARRKAERAHVVVANHSFVLARQEFLRHVVFDECEHLHDQARSAWSHEVTTAGLVRELDAVFNAKNVRGPLADALGAAPGGSFIEGVAGAAIDRQKRARRMVRSLERALVDYESWRVQEERGRAPRDRHGVFREYIQNGPSGKLISAHRELVSALAGLDAGVSSFLDHIEELPSKKRERIRDRLTTCRLALHEATNALDAWLPEDHEQATLVPRMSPEVFYAAAADENTRRAARQNERLSAQVLLPQEELGSRYFPELESCILISATTRIGGSFDASARYLGLDRTANPKADEPREGREYETYHTPEVFDYGRVLICVPRDAPSVRERDAYLAYVARFITHLAVRTRGRTLVLFTNGRDLAEVGRALNESMTASGVRVFAQNAGIAKEELSALFRETKDSILLGLDTFWYGADFPGQTLEYLVIVRLPFGVPDDYHHAQEAAMGSRDQRRSVYMPRALSRFRQGFGRLMRTESDKGCVFILDKRVIEPRQRQFLRELPLAEFSFDMNKSVLPPGAGKDASASTSDSTIASSAESNNAGEADSMAAAEATSARLVRGETDLIFNAAFAHMEMLPDIARRGLDTSFATPAPPSSPRAEYGTHSNYGSEEFCPGPDGMSIGEMLEAQAQAAAPLEQPKPSPNQSRPSESKQSKPSAPGPPKSKPVPETYKPKVKPPKPFIPTEDPPF